MRPSVKGSIGVRELGHAWARLDCLNSSSSGCVPPPPGRTLKPGFLSHGVTASHLVIFRQDTPDNESGQGTNGALNVDRTRQSTTGSPTGSNAHGDRVPVVAQRLG